jgi:small subunit ribosomal protein S5
VPAEDLWKGVTSVSNAGRKRGRAKGLVRKRDLNKGQVIGIGKVNIQWPGLNAPIIRGRELIQRKDLPPDPEREAKLVKLRDQMVGRRFAKLTPLERGWSGNKMPGRSIGPPDPIREDKFEGFDTRVLELKTVFNMKGNLGRKRRLSGFVVTGNSNGLAGFSTAKAVDSKSVLRKAKNRAAQKLMYIERDGNHIFHDFFCQFGRTKVFVSKRPDGYGLVCHRAIKTICEVAGITDLHAKVEGSTNLQHITKAFFLGLLNQKTYEKIAEAKGLHVVEFSKATGDFPKVLASPTVVREKIPWNENMDFNQFAMDGKLVLKRKKFPPFYVNTYGYQKYLKKLEKRRNHFKIKFDSLVKHDEIKSFLTDKFSEARPPLPKHKRTKPLEATPEES